MGRPWGDEAAGRFFVVDDDLLRRQCAAIAKVTRTDVHGHWGLLAVLAALTVLGLGHYVTSGEHNELPTALSFLAAGATAAGASEVSRRFRLLRSLRQRSRPGSLLVCEAGPAFLRVSDDETSHEFAYSALRRVRQAGEMVVIETTGHQVFALPREILPADEVGYIRSRMTSARLREGSPTPTEHGPPR